MYFNSLPQEKAVEKEIDQVKELLQSNNGKTMGFININELTGTLADNYDSHSKDLTGFRSVSS